MAVTFGAISTVVNAAATSAGVTGASITISGSGVLLLVALQANPGLTSPAITFNGISMTQIGTGFADTGSARVYIFALLSPSVGTFTPIATWNSITASVSLISVFYNNVVQGSLPSNTQNTANITAGPQTASISIDSVATPFVVVFLASWSGTISATAGATLRATGTTQPQWADSDANSVPGSTGYNMSFSWTGGSTAFHAVQLELNGSVTSTLSLTRGSFVLTGFATTLLKAHNYILSLAKGTYTMVGFALFTKLPEWTNQIKHSSIFTNETKD